MNKNLPKAGQKTGEFGHWLTRELKDQPRYQVYYDHGNSQKHDNVKVIKAFLGERVSRNNKLADVDVLVANQENEILLLIEIEESPLSPKTLLGDVFASVFSSRFGINVGGVQKYYQVTQKTKLLVAGYIPNINLEQPNLINEIYLLFEEFHFPRGSVSASQIEFVIDTNLQGCIKHLQEKVLEELNQRNPF